MKAVLAPESSTRLPGRYPGGSERARQVPVRRKRRHRFRCAARPAGTARAPCTTSAGTGKSMTTRAQPGQPAKNKRIVERGGTMKNHIDYSERRGVHAALEEGYRLAGLSSNQDVRSRRDVILCVTLTTQWTLGVSNRQAADSSDYSSARPPVSVRDRFPGKLCLRIVPSRERPCFASINP